jgi:hypothetical protein
MHKGRCSFVAIERASFAFAFFEGSPEPEVDVIAAVLFIFAHSPAFVFHSFMKGQSWQI